jgi:hypothetical protein
MAIKAPTFSHSPGMLLRTTPKPPAADVLNHPAFHLQTGRPPAELAGKSHEGIDQPIEYRHPVLDPMPIMLALRRNRRQIRRKVANHRDHRFGVILPAEIDLRRHVPGLLQHIEQGQNLRMRSTRFEKPLARLQCLRHASQPQWRLIHCQINPINTVSLGLAG